MRKLLIVTAITLLFLMMTIPYQAEENMIQTGPEEEARTTRAPSYSFVEKFDATGLIDMKETTMEIDTAKGYAAIPTKDHAIPVDNVLHTWGPRYIVCADFNDEQGHWLIGGGTCRLNKYDGETYRDISYGLVNFKNSIKDIANNGSHWMVLGYYGLNLYDGCTFEDMSEYVNGVTTSVATNGTHWLVGGLQKKLFIYDGVNFNDISSGLINMTSYGVSTIATNGTHWYILAHNGPFWRVNCYHDGVFTDITNHIPGWNMAKMIHELYWDGKSWWAGGEHSNLIKFNGNTFTNYTSPLGFGSKKVVSIHSTKSDIVVGGDDKSMATIGRSSGTVTDISSRLMGFAATSDINTIHCNTTNYLIGSTHGGLNLGPPPGQAVKFVDISPNLENFGQKNFDGIASNGTHAILWSDQGGILEYDGGSFTDISDRFKVFTTNYAIRSAGWNGSKWVMGSHSGKIFTYDGVVATYDTFGATEVITAVGVAGPHSWWLGTDKGSLILYSGSSMNDQTSMLSNWAGNQINDILFNGTFTFVVGDKGKVNGAGMVLPFTDYSSSLKGWGMNPVEGISITKNNQKWHLVGGNGRYNTYDGAVFKDETSGVGTSSNTGTASNLSATMITTAGTDLYKIGVSDGGKTNIYPHFPGIHGNALTKVTTHEFSGVPTWMMAGTGSRIYKYGAVHPLDHYKVVSKEIDGVDDVIGTVTMDITSSRKDAYKGYISGDYGLHWEAVDWGLPHVLEHPGEHLRYKVVISDDGDIISVSTLDQVDIDYTLTDRPGFLSLIDDDNGVDPDEGNFTTEFKFSVMYTDLDGDGPEGDVKLKVVDELGEEVDGSPFILSDSQTQEPDFSLGVVYDTTITLDPGHTYSHSFHASYQGSVSMGTTAISLGPFDGPTVHDLAPTLFNASVDPMFGTSSTVFTYIVTYQDPEGVDAETAELIVDDTRVVPVTFLDQGSDWSIYTFETTLDAGVHSYHFNFSDGENVVRYPVVGNFSGPTVYGETDLPIGFLYTPLNGSFITEEAFDLGWGSTYTGEETILYDVFVAPVGEEPEDPYLDDFGGISYDPTDITEGEYHWMVVPYVNGIRGIQSPTWTFEFRPGYVPSYEFSLEADQYSFVMEGSETQSTNLVLTNLGDTVNTFSLQTLDRAGWVTLVDDGFYLAPDGFHMQTVQVTIPDGVAQGEYLISIEATSLNGSVVRSIQLQITVVEEGFIPIYELDLELDVNKVAIKRGNEVNVSMEVLNLGNIADVATFAYSVESGDGDDLTFNLSKRIVRLGLNGTGTNHLEIWIPANTREGEIVIDVTIFSDGLNATADNETLVIDVKGENFVEVYGVNLTSELSDYTFKAGTIGMINLSIKNTGNVQTTYTISHQIGNLPAAYLLVPVSQVTVGVDGQETVSVIINIPSSADDSEHDLTFTVAGSGATDSVDVSLSIQKASSGGGGGIVDGGDGDGGSSNSIPLWAIVLGIALLLLLLIIIGVIIALVFRRKKPEEEEEIPESLLDSSTAEEAEVVSIGETKKDVPVRKPKGMSGKTKPIEPEVVPAAPAVEEMPKMQALPPLQPGVVDEADLATPEELTELQPMEDDALAEVEDAIQRSPVEVPTMLSLPPAIPLEVEAKERSYQIEEVLIMNTDGLLLSHFSTGKALAVDEDVLAGMLTAVQAFVKDSFNLGGKGLSDLTMGDYRVFISTGKNVSLAAVTSGYHADGVRKQLDQTRKFIEESFGTELPSWNGDLQTLSGMEDIMREFVEGKYE